MGHAFAILGKKKKGKKEMNTTHSSVHDVCIRAITFYSKFKYSFEIGGEKFLFECNDLFKIKMYSL